MLDTTAVGELFHTADDFRWCVACGDPVSGDGLARLEVHHQMSMLSVFLGHQVNCICSALVRAVVAVVVGLDICSKGADTMSVVDQRTSFDDVSWGVDATDASLGGECIEVACNVVGAIYNHDGRPGCIWLAVLGGAVSFLEKSYHPFNVGLMFVGGAEVHFNLVVFQLCAHIHSNSLSPRTSTIMNSALL